MTGHDWLVGEDRRAAGAERIYTAAMDLVIRDGIDALDIDVLAARVHCSRATIYRHAGGKAEIRDAVLARAAARIVDTVRQAVAGRKHALAYLFGQRVAQRRGKRTLGRGARRVLFLGGLHWNGG